MQSAALCRTCVPWLVCCVCHWQPRDELNWVVRGRGRTFSVQKKIRRRRWFARSTSRRSWTPHPCCNGTMVDTRLTRRKLVAQIRFTVPGNRMADLVKFLHEVKLNSCWRDYGLCETNSMINLMLFVVHRSLLCLIGTTLCVFNIVESCFRAVQANIILCLIFLLLLLLLGFCYQVILRHVYIKV